MAKQGRLHLYRSYNFRDKDPIIDALRTVVQDEGLKESQVGMLSDVSSGTLHNWFNGTTRRPQFTTIAAAANGLGYKTIRFDARGLPSFEKVKDINFPRALDKIADEILKKKKKKNGHKNGNGSHK